MIKVINLQRTDEVHLHRLTPLDLTAIKRKETYNEYKKEMDNIDTIKYLPLESAFKRLNLKKSTSTNNKSDNKIKKMTPEEVYENIVEDKRKRKEQQEKEKTMNKSHSLSKLARVNNLKDNTLLKSTITLKKQKSVVSLQADTSSIWNNTVEKEKRFSIMSSSILRSKNLNRSVSDYKQLNSMRTIDDNSRIYKKSCVKPGEQSARKAIENIMKTNEAFTTLKSAVNDIYSVLSSKGSNKNDSFEFWKSLTPEIANTKRLRKGEMKDNFLAIISEVQQEIDRTKILNRI